MKKLLAVRPCPDSNRGARGMRNALPYHTGQKPSRCRSGRSKQINYEKSCEYYEYSSWKSLNLSSSGRGTLMPCSVIM